MLKIIEVEERRSARVKGGQLDIIPMTAMEVRLSPFLYFLFIDLFLNSRIRSWL